MRHRIRRLRSGNYQIHLSEQERAILQDLPPELIKLLESGDDDGSIFRLFPPGYSDDMARQVEFDRLMRDELQERHVTALRLLESTAGAVELTEDELNAWMKAINHLRLVLGTRLDITNNWAPEDIAPDDPRVSAFALYEYLSVLLEDAVVAMSDGI